jgi:hypothetical protein
MVARKSSIGTEERRRLKLRRQRLKRQRIDNTSRKSVRTVSGGAPSLGKRK